MANTPPSIPSSDPYIQRQVDRETATILGNSLTSSPIVSGSETVYPLSTTSTSRDAVTVTTSVNNDSGDITTVYSTRGQINVNSVNQTINQFTSVDSGVNQIIAGTGIAISSERGNGTGIVTVSTTGLGNVSSLNLDGNVSNVLRGDGTWGADANSSYGNSNVVSLLGSFGSNTITTTGIITGNGSGLSSVPYANLTGAPTLGNISTININGNSQTWLAGNGVFANIAIPSVGNIATLNLDGNASNLLTGAGTYVAIPVVPTVGNIATINLDGNVSNVLRGDGTWGADAISSYGDSNVTSLLGAFGSNTIVTTGIITADGANLSNVPYANLTGAPTLGNISAINIDGNASNVLLGSGLFGAVPGLGNIASINLDGNVSNVLAGNGTFVALPVIDANTVVWTTAPVANTSAGTAGQAAYDTGGNLFVCVSTNTWAKFSGTTSW